MKTLFENIARNIHEMCTNIYDCAECKLYVKNNGICPYECIFYLAEYVLLLQIYILVHFLRILT